MLSPRSSLFIENYLSIIATLAFFGGVILIARYWERIGEAVQPAAVDTSGAKLDTNAGPLPTVVKLGDNSSPNRNPPATNERAAKASNPPSTPGNMPTVITRIPAQTAGQNPPAAIGNNPAGAVEPGRIQVVDGDTVRLDGKSFRLVGIDTPESGTLAKCEAERQLAARASARMREIVASGALRLDRVACVDCPPGTEGTTACNYGRLCGVLTASGRDVGLILIGEGLAKRYNCTGSGCPPKQAWCS